MSKLPLALRIASNAAASLVFAFLVFPILAVVPASFNEASFIYLPPRAYSGVWYERFLEDAEWQTSLVNSLHVAVLSTAIAVVLGTLAAIGLRRLEGRWRAGITALFLAPMIVPVVVTAVALYRSALDVGLSGTVVGMSLGHMILALPFVVINVGIALRAVDENWLRAASGLGGSPWTVFRTITLPNITPGIVGGAVFSFITSFDEVVVAVFLAGYSNKTLPVKIWESIRLEFTPVIAVAATVMIVLAVALFAVAQLASRGKEPATI
ncbi:MAG TPA: ABC transporter permease [Mesorhizobium sp.]|jgi:putative spermidine/putrescine transport system permease protein|nr:ABC transporter permease [Mesorhizobium sp.]